MSKEFVNHVDDAVSRSNIGLSDGRVHSTPFHVEDGASINVIVVEEETLLWGENVGWVSRRVDRVSCGGRGLQCFGLERGTLRLREIMG